MLQNIRSSLVASHKNLTNSIFNNVNELKDFISYVNQSKIKQILFILAKPVHINNLLVICVQDC